MTPILAALFINDRLRTESAHQNRELREIKEQTNGVLNKRMRQSVREVLEETGLVVTEPTVETTPVPAPPPTETTPEGWGQGV